MFGSQPWLQPISIYDVMLYRIFVNNSVLLRYFLDASKCIHFCIYQSTTMFKFIVISLHLCYCIKSHFHFKLQSRFQIQFTKHVLSLPIDTVQRHLAWRHMSSFCANISSAPLPKNWSIPDSRAVSASIRGCSSAQTSSWHKTLCTWIYRSDGHFRVLSKYGKTHGGASRTTYVRSIEICLIGDSVHVNSIFEQTWLSTCTAVFVLF